MNIPQNPAKPTSRRRPRGCLAVIIFMIGLLLVASLVDTLARYLLAPWSLPQGGKPAMTGEWSGPVTLENGVTGTLRLVLQDTLDLEESWFGLNIDGSARYCLGELSGDFEVYGQADRQGNIAYLHFRALEEDPIWLLYNTSSRWQSDILEINGTYSFDPTTAHISRSDDPDPAIRLTLKQSAGDTSCPLNGP